MTSTIKRSSLTEVQVSLKSSQGTMKKQVLHYYLLQLTQTLTKSMFFGKEEMFPHWTQFIHSEKVTNGWEYMEAKTQMEILLASVGFNTVNQLMRKTKQKMKHFSTLSPQ